MLIAIQGTHGSFSEAAAHRRWPDARIVPCREARDVVTAVRNHQADAGCLPIENSIIGSVTMTYDLLEEAFGDGKLILTHETLQPVHHTLMSVRGASLAEVRRVLSHQVALDQCQQWLARHLAHAERIGTWDTAGAAAMVAREHDPTVAAIAARHAADVYDLVPLAEHIEDDASNQTRFLTFTRADAPLLSSAPSNGPSRHKTSLIVRLDHRPGTLARVLQAFATRGVNLTAITSRPERAAPWTYRFYIDVEGATTDRQVADAIDEVAAEAPKVVSLGSYLA